MSEPIPAEPETQGGRRDPFRFGWPLAVMVVWAVAMWAVFQPQAALDREVETLQAIDAQLAAGAITEDVAVAQANEARDALEGRVRAFGMSVFLPVMGGLVIGSVVSRRRRRAR